MLQAPGRSFESQLRQQQCSLRRHRLPPSGVRTTSRELLPPTILLRVTHERMTSLIERGDGTEFLRLQATYKGRVGRRAAREASTVKPRCAVAAREQERQHLRVEPPELRRLHSDYSLRARSKAMYSPSTPRSPQKPSAFASHPATSGTLRRERRIDLQASSPYQKETRPDTAQSVGQTGRVIVPNRFRRRNQRFQTQHVADRLNVAFRVFRSIFFATPPLINNMSKNYKNIEERIKEALVAWDTSKYRSITRLALDFGVHPKRLQRRIKGGDSRTSRPATNKALTEAQEQAIRLYIRRLDTLELSARYPMIANAANLLLHQAHFDPDSEPPTMERSGQNAFLLATPNSLNGKQSL